MSKFCANLSWLYSELPLIERVGAAKAAGFEAVEILFPYDGDAAALREALAVHDLPLALINCPPPNYADPDGPRGFAAVPGEEARFRSGFRRVLRYADAMKADKVHIMAGAATGPEARQTYIGNLRSAAEQTDIPLTIEPINTDDMPGYFLNSFDLALEVLDEVGHPGLSLQFDIYHAHMITGDVLSTWDKVRHSVSHVQFADVPGRGAPGTGELDLKGIFNRIREDGYDGWISAEYKTGKDTRKNLNWLTSY